MLESIIIAIFAPVAVLLQLFALIRGITRLLDLQQYYPIATSLQLRLIAIVNYDRSRDTCAILKFRGIFFIIGSKSDIYQELGAVDFRYLPKVPNAEMVFILFYVYK